MRNRLVLRTFVLFFHSLLITMMIIAIPIEAKSGWWSDAVERAQWSGMSNNEKDNFMRSNPNFVPPKNDLNYMLYQINDFNNKIYQYSSSASIDNTINTSADVEEFLNLNKDFVLIKFASGIDTRGYLTGADRYHLYFKIIGLDVGFPKEDISELIIIKRKDSKTPIASNDIK